MPMFDEWVREHSRGTLNEDMTAAIRNVVQAVTDLDKKGTVVLKLTIEPAGRHGRTVAIGGEVEEKPPAPAPELSVYFPDEKGGLHRNDPYQERLPEVPSGTVEVGGKTVDRETGEVKEDDGDD